MHVNGFNSADDCQDIPIVLRAKYSRERICFKHFLDWIDAVRFSSSPRMPFEVCAFYDWVKNVQSPFLQDGCSTVDTTIAHLPLVVYFMSSHW